MIKQKNAPGESHVTYLNHFDYARCGIWPNQLRIWGDMSRLPLQTLMMFVIVDSPLVSISYDIVYFKGLILMEVDMEVVNSCRYKLSTGGDAIY